MSIRMIPMIAFCLFAAGSLASGAVHYVPDDFPTIQAAITGASDYDMIIVRPGTYNENIVFGGRMVHVRSEAGPLATVIDGGRRGSVVTFEDGEYHAAGIRGFTITNGSGTLDGQIAYGGGICCRDACPSITANIIRDNVTDGAPDRFGGGIYIRSNLTKWQGRIVNNLIVGNYASKGGGIYEDSTERILLRYCTISGNAADDEGGGIWTANTLGVTGSIIWDNIATADPEIAGLPSVDHSDVKGGFAGHANIDADPLFFDPQKGDYRLRQDPCQPGVVNPCVDTGGSKPNLSNGSTRTDGEQDLGNVDMGFRYRVGRSGTYTVPGDYATIQDAVDSCGDGATIVVRPGVYVGQIHIEDRAISLVSEMGADVTVLDGDWADMAPVIGFRDTVGGAAAVSGFTITNGYFWAAGGIWCERSIVSITNNRIHDNASWEGGAGGIDAISGFVSIIGNVISRNDAGAWGGGINCGDGLIANNFIIDNEAAGGGGICCGYGDPLIVNNTIVGNRGHFGNGIQVWNGANPTVANCIIRNRQDSPPTAKEIWLRKGPATLTISHCNLRGGQGRIEVESNCTLHLGTGMIDVDPGYASRARADYHLRYDSPCRSAGDAAVLPSDLTLDFEGDPRIAFGGVDIGADEYHYHLYRRGSATPGGTIDICQVGRPLRKSLLALGSGIRPQPLPTPYGDLFLDGPLTVWTTGPIPARGILCTPIRIPASWPPGVEYFQAYAGGRYTNLLTLRIE